MANHKVIYGESPSLITGGVLSEEVLKRYLARPVVKTSGIGRVVNHDHGRAAAFGEDVVRNLLLLGVKDRERVVIEDLVRGLSFTGIVRLLKTRAYVRIPKALWQFYQRGDEVVALITPLHTR